MPPPFNSENHTTHPETGMPRMDRHHPKYVTGYPLMVRNYAPDKV